MPDAGDGLPEMLGDLIQGNIDRHPERADLIRGHHGRANLIVEDAGVSCGLVFTGERLEIQSELEDAELTFRCPADVLMTLTHVPLRFGMPDQLSKAGREISTWMMNGTLKVTGIPRHLPLMIRLQRLFTVT